MGGLFDHKSKWELTLEGISLFEWTTVELFDQSSKFDKYQEKKYKGYLDAQYLTELRKLKYILIPVMIS